MMSKRKQARSFAETYLRELVADLKAGRAVVFDWSAIAHTVDLPEPDGSVARHPTGGFTLTLHYRDRAIAARLIGPRDEVASG
jgi:hypothetical protein